MRQGQAGRSGRAVYKYTTAVQRRTVVGAEQLGIELSVRHSKRIQNFLFNDDDIWHKKKGFNLDQMNCLVFRPDEQTDPVRRGPQKREHYPKVNLGFCKTPRKVSSL